MIYSQPARRAPRRIRIRRARVAGLLAVLAAIVAVVGAQWPSSAPSPLGDGVRGTPGDAGGVIAIPRREPRADLGEADGAVPAGTTVFDDDVPGVANLNADLLDALRDAAARAADDGVELLVDSGWRSPEYQERLLDEAVAKYGSKAEAARWVATPDRSAHVSGDAVDIGPATAAAWLSEHGSGYGLCRIYANEPWHFELRPQAIGHGCPPVYADPTHDPRMQQ